MVPEFVGKIIDSRQHRAIGSGFLVLVDRERNEILIATCFHVIERHRTSKHLKFQFFHEGVTVDISCTDQFDQTHDVALLKGEIASSLPTNLQSCVLLSPPHISNGTRFFTVGFGKIPNNNLRANIDYITAVGSISGMSNFNGVEYLQLDSKGILVGMSGSPIIAPKLPFVVGMITFRHNVNPTQQTWSRDLAFATFSAHISALDKRLTGFFLPKDQFASNQSKVDSFLSNGNWYRISNVLLGKSFSLAVARHSPNQLYMCPTNDEDSQWWRIEKYIWNGHYRFTNKFLGSDRWLDTYGIAPHKPFMGETGGFSGQSWVLWEVKKGIYRLTNMFLGDNRALSATIEYENSPSMEIVTNDSSQQWRIDKVE